MGCIEKTAGCISKPAPLFSCALSYIFSLPLHLVWFLIKLYLNDVSRSNVCYLRILAKDERVYLLDVLFFFH